MTEESRTKAKDLELQEEASLTSGSDSWHLQGLTDKGYEGYMITDGPYGLRKATGSDVYGSVPATCFPPTAGLASSWNPDLTYQVGQAMGEECVQEKVAVILGPGINIKRSPLGGRNFEFYSEDPVLAGHEAAGLVEGVQSKGVGTSLKHFAANNQETDRFRVSSDVDMRTLREIYLPAFEYVVRNAKPWTIMCAYNKLNGVFSSENRWLLTDVLRGEWGYQGMVMSDWGAVHNRVNALQAGLNLEMPPSRTDDQVVQAVQVGKLDKEQLDRMAQGVLDLIEKARPAMSRQDYRYDVQEHNNMARRAAQESIVLLRNEDRILPLDPKEKIAVIGEFARTPRYQGGGSSHITPTEVSSVLGGFKEAGINVDFAPGFTLDEKEQDPALTQQALEVARGADTVVLFLGLPEYAESEGFDRTSMDLPDKQVALLRAVSEVNDRVVAVLSNGAVVTVADWMDNTKGLLETWLLGQEGGRAVVDVLTGAANPSGHLPETIPVRLEDNPTITSFPGEEGHSRYGEGVYVGYRYYDTFQRPVAFPFGFGLSYADFALERIAVTKTGANSARVEVTVTNTSQADGAQTVQVYVAPCSSRVNRPSHELKAFTKVFLKAGQSSRVSMDLTERDFAYWSTVMDGWHVEAGTYRIQVGTSSRDLVAEQDLQVDGDGRFIPLNAESTMAEWRENSIGGPILRDRIEQDGIPLPDDPNTAQLFDTMPLASVITLSGGDGNGIVADMVDRYHQALKQQGLDS